LWRHVLRKVLVAGHVIARPAITMKVLDRHPEPQELRSGQMIVVVSDGRPKWAYFQCPGNCGGHVRLSLDLLHRPRWKIRADFLARPTISPAAFRHSDCGAQFALRRGRIDCLEQAAQDELARVD
jgi:hypothetical protein